MIPGLESGMSGSPTKMAFPAWVPYARADGDKDQKRLKGRSGCAKALAALNLFQKTVKIMSGKLALAATANASETRNATFSDWAKTASRIERTDTPMEAHLAAIISLFFRSRAFSDNLAVYIMRKSRSRRQDKSCNYRQNRGESDG